MLPETSEIQSFLAVSDLGSVSGAARELGLPRATVSRRLARLEERLGVRLVHRTTRRLQLTDSGEEFYVHARSVLDAIEMATASVRRDDGVPSGLLRLSVPPVTDLRFAQMLLDFSTRHPAVELEVTATTEHQDLIARNIDVAMRATSELDPSLIARRLLLSDLLAVASPEYLERAGVPSSPAELTGHRCVVGFEQGVRPATHWPLRDGGRVQDRGALVSNSLELLLAAALQGLGIALLPRPSCARPLAAGTLVEVLPSQVGETVEVSLVYPDRRLLKPAVRAFVDHAVEWIGKTDMDEASSGGC